MNSGPSGEQTQVATLPSKRWTEDLSWQAKRGAELGRRHCNCDGFYHTLWGALRASRFDGNLRSEESEPAASALSPLLRDGARVLIGGAADPATFCEIGRIAEPRRPDVTIVDKCEAPLRLVEEFAAMRGVRCNTLHGDILDLDGGTAWDLIVLHYTASFILPDRRRHFFECLARSLAPGGTLVWVAEGRRDGNADREKLESEWFGQARQAFRASELVSLWDDAEFDRMLRDYAAERTARRLNVVSIHEIKGLLHAAGLAVSREVTVERKWDLRGRPVTGADVASSVIISAMLAPD